MQRYFSLTDDRWTRRAGPAGVQIALTTFGILALELAIIRWASGQVRVLAFFNNLILISAFLGMGLGAALGARKPGLVHWTLPCLALLSALFAFSEPLGIMHTGFADSSIYLWGAENPPGRFPFIRGLVIVLGLVLLVTAIFVCAGSALGRMFGELPALRAYTWDLAGSVAGIAAFTVVTFFHATPPLWLGLGAAPFFWLSGRLTSAAALLAVIVLGGLSVGEAAFSPYNRIDIEQDGFGLRLSANRDFHQYMHDLSDARVRESAGSETLHAEVTRYRRAYDLPFVINDRRESALIVGAGTGNDVAAALRAGYGRVLSVDIDPVILRKGAELHPERPYSDPRVERVTDDARAFFEQHEGELFDVVCYGLLDSHAMLSAMSSLRLENYVYTREGLNAAWEHVAPGGHMSLSFSVLGGDWLADRIYWTLAEATGRTPVMIDTGIHYARAWVVAREGAGLHMERAGEFAPLQPVTPRAETRLTRDNWPFLYVRPGVFPWGYVLVLAGVLGLALLAIPRAFAVGTERTGFDPVMFLLGAAFLLIETRGVTTMSLLFGTTWLVNSAIFGGIVTMALAANVFAERARLKRCLPWFAPLAAATLLLWGVEAGPLNRFPLFVRGVIGGTLTALPIGFAGIIVSVLLARSRRPAAALGSNLLGAVVGGCIEYLSMLTGLRALALLALAFYTAAFVGAWMQLRSEEDAAEA